MVDKELEYLSNKVRMGIPVDFLDAVRVVDYQHRKKSFWDKVVGYWYYMSGKTGELIDVKKEGT